MPPSPPGAPATDPDALLGHFVRKYAGPPGVADASSRSSIREDAVIQEVGRLLAEVADRPVRVADICCGYGSLAGHLERGLVERAGRVEYRAADQDIGCVTRVRGRGRGGLAGCEVRLAEVWDLPAGWAGEIDLAVLNNVLHELPPVRYPELFTGLNRLLTPGTGHAFVVDMEDLPAAEPEAVAVNWTPDEVRAFLTAGGLAAAVTHHEKSVGVFQARVKHTAAALNGAGMLTEIRRLLGVKLAAAAEARRALPGESSGDREQLMRWVVLTGTMARLAEEVLAVDRRLEELKPKAAPPAG